MKRIILFAFFTGLFVSGYSQANNDTLAIKRVIEKESATWRSGDVKGHAECWFVRPYSRILVSTGDSNVLDIPPEIMINPPAGVMGKGGTSVNTNYKMNVSGNNAWVTLNEVSTSKEGSKTYSYEMKILEKINGQWKLVGQSIHLYKPK